MIERAHNDGIKAALEYFKLGGLIDSGIGAAKALGVMGQAPEAFVQGSRAFAPGGALNLKNVLWPSIPGDRLRTWGGRAGTIAGAAMLPGMMRQDQNEGGVSKLLGGVGGLAGLMYGGTAGGWLGAPVGMAIGRRLGHGVGHLLGSHPNVQQRIQ